MLDRKFEETVAAGDADFRADIRSMILNRPHANAKFVGDLAAGFVLGDHTEDLSLGRRKRAKASH